MENASKALIIAGAILIAILLISVGVWVMNSVNPLKDSAQQQTDAMAIQTFNAQFVDLEGENVSASQVREIFSKVNSSNVQDSAHKVKIIGAQTGDAPELTNYSSIVTKKQRYSVSVEYGTDGYISIIRIY